MIYLGLLLVLFSVISTSFSENTILSYAYKTYGELRKFYIDSTQDDWKVSNAWDTMTDYLLLAWDEHPDHEITKIALNKAQTFVGCWYDDFGWNGVSAVKSFDPQYEEVFGEHKEDFKKIALQAYKIMSSGKSDHVHFGSPNVWKNRDNQTFFKPKPPIPKYWAKPRFENGVGSGLQGVHQYDIYHTFRIPANGWIGPPECGSHLMAPSEETRFGPYQTTVMNGLLFVISLRLHIWDSEEVNTLTSITDQYGFWKAWFGYDSDYPVSDADSLLLQLKTQDSGQDSGVLVRERVSTYAKQDGVYPQVFNFDELTCWGGDNGHVLGGMMDYLTIFPGDRMCEEVMRNITLGILQMEKENGLQPWYPTVNNKLEKWDAVDYKSGSGILMRYLYYAYKQKNSPIKAILETKDYQDFLCRITQTAAKVEQKDLFDSMNVLSTMVAAQTILLDPDSCDVSG